MLGILVSGVALYWALREIDWAALGKTLVAVSAADLALCAVLAVIGIAARGWRWRTISNQPGASVLRFARAVNLGLLGNQLLPGRAGELVRVFALVRLLPTRLSVALGSAILDRAVDVAVLLLSAWALSATMSGMTTIPAHWVASLGILVAAMAVGLVLIRSRTFGNWFAAWSRRWLHRWPLRPEIFLAEFNGLSSCLARPAPALKLALAACVVWVADYLIGATAMSSVGLALPYEAPLLLWVALAASSALPSAPGYVGLYQLAFELCFSKTIC
jgi:uncharacterized protein (TIRG00374 family)